MEMQLRTALASPDALHHPTRSVRYSGIRHGSRPRVESPRRLDASEMAALPSHPFVANRPSPSALSLPR